MVNGSYSDTDKNDVEGLHLEPEASRTDYPPEDVMVKSETCASVSWI